MPIMLSKTYAALVAAGAPEAAASEAAEEIADFERKISSMQSDIKLINLDSTKKRGFITFSREVFTGVRPFFSIY